MKNFWALPAVWRAALVIAAQKHAFSVNDDLLAYPQFEIQWSEDYVTDAFARERLRHKHRRELQNEQRHGEDTGNTGAHVERYKPPAEPDDDQNHGEGVYYEEMVLSSQRYLCAIPDIPSTSEDEAQQNDTLTKVEEEKELARANARGWELMAGMKGNCVYYNAGWWSYSFCYSLGVRQFHQLSQARGVPVWPPVEDPSVDGFMLGTYSQKDDGGKQNRKKTDDLATAPQTSSLPLQGELVVKGETRYLMQKLSGGSECDLTGDDRRVEIQFHCNPSVGMDHISLIKETSTCQYLLVVQTPRLCNDVAFLPPQKDQPNGIVCQPILQQHDVQQYKDDLETIKETIRHTEELFEQSGNGITTDNNPKQLQIVGDIIVGGHAIVPKDLKLEKSAIVGGGKETFVATVANSDGQSMPKVELDKLGLGDARSIDKLKKELEKMAGGRGWKLDVVDTPRGREYRGIIDEETDEQQQSNDDGSADTEGSQEEFYKEEL